MLKSPSKHLSRAFLSSLLRERGLSPSGIEYCEEEVRSALFEKETRLAEEYFLAQMLKLKPEINHISIIMAHQERMFLNPIPGIVKGIEKVSQEETPSVQCATENNFDTIFHLPVKTSSALVVGANTVPHQSNPVPEETYTPRGRDRRKERALKTFKGHKVISQGKVYSGSKLRAERIRHEAVMKRIKDLIYAPIRANHSQTSI